MKTIRLNDLTHSKRVVFFCWLAYACSYIGRMNFSAAVAAIVSDGIFTKSQAGLIGTVFFFCYGAGQLINGYLGDRFSPFKMIFGGLIFSSLANLSMCFGGGYIVMAAVWGINGLAMSMLWSPILRIFSNVINDSLKQRACLNIYSSFPVGAITSYAASTLIIKYFAWRSVFAFASGMLALALTVGLIIYAGAQKHFEYAQPAVSTDKGEKGKSGVGMGKLILSSGLVLVMIPTMLHGAIKDGLNTWVPTMLTEAYPITPSLSIFLTIALPIFGLFGAYGISPLYKKAFKCDEMNASVFAAVFCLFPLAALMFIGKIPLLVSVLMLSLTTTAMHALNYMLVTMVPVRFAVFNKTATVAGMVNASTYVGSTISSYGFGTFSDSFGWQKTIVLWVAIILVVLLSCLLAHRKWYRFTNK